MFMRKSSKHPVLMKTSYYVNLPFFLVEEQHIDQKSVVEYERVGKDGLIIKIGGAK
jgi:hypothetical protein